MVEGLFDDYDLLGKIFVAVPRPDGMGYSLAIRSLDMAFPRLLTEYGDHLACERLFRNLLVAQYQLCSLECADQAVFGFHSNGAELKIYICWWAGCGRESNRVRPNFPPHIHSLLSFVASDPLIDTAALHQTRRQL